ncbi:DEAD/DEAH box helicase [Collinsella tanakaei]|uniref:DEAD/DEAH box helicase n=1 Tax=Collinsella tanakaei TaxID=626935 RepID=UPI00248E19DF|nr:DEAD/DEAH box helicase family protein [Collinsella tanakaei]
MRIELKDFQAKAVSTLSSKLESMRRRYEQDGETSSICLASPTGSGKTVMCAATIEALFFGDDDLGLSPDENAVVLWLSDSPSLNEQTCVRFANVADKLADNVLDHRHLETVTNHFGAAHDVLDPRHVYFLSKDLLSRNGLLTKGGELNSGRIFWDILDRTIKDPERNLYLFIDEAHRGLGSNASSDKGTGTIYANLIDGYEGRAAMPIVVGVSATPQRFDAAMDLRENRIRMPRVTVTPREVQESGLLKDIIELRVPEKDDPVEHQYLTMACQRFALACSKWDEYCSEQGERSIHPLLLVQTADNISMSALAELCDQIMSLVPGLNEATCFANVFGEHKMLAAGKYLIPYIDPEFVQDSPNVRVLFAKEAVSNGWDCPRAEVIFSQRRRSDSTYIAQLVGRMVRTPLARRIDGDDILNSVACYLPQFNPDSTKDVVDYLMGRKDAMGESSIGAKNIVLKPVTVTTVDPRTDEDYEDELEQYEANQEAIKKAKERQPGFQPPIAGIGARGSLEDALVPIRDEEPIIDSDKTDSEPPSTTDGSTNAIPKPADGIIKPITPAQLSKPKPPTKQEQSFTKEEWAGIKEAFGSIPVQRIPKKARNEFQSLLRTASLLVETGLDRDAARDVNHKFSQRLAGSIVSNEDEYLAARHEVEVSETVKITLDKLNETETSSQEEAMTDPEGLRKAARDADVRFGKELTQAYRRENYAQLGRQECDLRLAAAVRTPTIVDDLERWAAKARKDYFDTVDGSGSYDFLSDAAKQRYDELARETEGRRLTRIEWPTSLITSDLFAKYPRHIVQKEDGLCPLELNDMEQAIVNTELSKARTVAFYRNPSGSMSAKAFSIPYMSSVGRKALHPDFIFFVRDAEGTVLPSLVDPHAEFLGDTLAKLKGYVSYLREFPNVFKQVLFVGDMGNKEYRVINLLRDDVQEAILSYTEVDCKALFYGPYANTYQ